MKRVCFLRPTLSTGGADRVTLTLLRELHRWNMTPELLLMRREGALIDQAPSSVQALGASSLWTSTGPLIKALKRMHPDVLFSTSTGTNIPAVLAWQALGKPFRLVLSERNVLFHGGRTPKRLLLTAAKRVLYPSADCVTVISQGIAHEMETELRVPREKIVVVYNPVVTQQVRDGAVAPLSHRFFDGKIPVILGVGRFVTEKGFDVLLRAFARVRAERPSRLLILGEGPLRGELESLARELGIAADVDMPGFDPNPFKYMARASVFALSSRHEGLPGVLIQAMACGAPVVSTDCPAGPSEIIARPGEDGLLVPVDDAEALASAIGRVLADENFARGLAAAGQRSANSRFDVDSALPRYVEAAWPGSTTGATSAARDSHLSNQGARS